MMTDKQRSAVTANLKYALIAVEKARAARRIEFRCKNCGNQFFLCPSKASKPNAGQFCSNPCRYAYKVGEYGPNFGPNEKMRGKNNPNYKDGTGYERNLRYKTPEINRWRRLVYRRDGFTCQRCGYKPTAYNQLRAHHIKPWSDYPDGRFDVANAVTLCKDCHAFVHSPDNSIREFLG